MAGDVQDIVRELLMNALEGSGKKASDAARNGNSNGSGAFSGMKGVVAGAGAAALVPLAVKNVAKHIGGLEDLAKGPGGALGDFASKLGDSVGSGIGDKVSDKVDESGGPSGILKDTVKGALPFGGGGDDGDGGGSKGGVRGVGKGRRMPVQQSVDIGIPLETVYNQWTQFEDWTTFMHRVTRVTQEDDCTLSFAAKIWGKTKEFTATIETQRPNERIKWKVSQGMTHTGVVTFHELGPNLTRVLLSIDVEPGGLIEKAARGMRHVKRAVRGDLHRFKAFIEMAEKETGAWRGVIENGDVVEEHDPTYDEDREYSDMDDLVDDSDEESGDDEGQDDDEDREASDDSEDEDDEPQAKRGRGRARAASEGSGSRSRTSGGRGSQSKSRSRSRGATNGGGSGARSKSSSSGSGSGSGSSRSKSGSSRAKSGSSSGRSRSSSSGRSGSSGGGSGSSRSRSGSSSSRSGSSRGSGSRQASGRQSRSRNSKS